MPWRRLRRPENPVGILFSFFFSLSVVNIANVKNLIVIIFRHCYLISQVNYSTNFSYSDCKNKLALAF